MHGGKGRGGIPRCRASGLRRLPLHPPITTFLTLLGAPPVPPRGSPEGQAAAGREARPGAGSRQALPQQHSRRHLARAASGGGGGEGGVLGGLPGIAALSPAEGGRGGAPGTHALSVGVFLGTPVGFFGGSGSGHPAASQKGRAAAGLPQ